MATAEMTAHHIVLPEELQKFLESRGVPIHTWGTGEAKTLAHLKKEIDEKEAFLVETPNGIMRHTHVARVGVEYGDYELYEDRQVFIDGRERRRGKERKGRPGIAEKIKSDELPKKGALRGLEEELGLSGEVVLCERGVQYKVGASRSFPGLISSSVQNFYTAHLSSEQFNPDGYEERQPDKTTYFIWKPKRLL